MTLTPTIMCVNCVNMFYVYQILVNLFIWYLQIVFYSICFILHISAEGTIDHTSYQGNNAVRKQFNSKFSLFSFFHNCALVGQNMKAMQANPALKLYFQPKIKLCIDDPFSGKENRKILIFVQCQTVFIFSILGHKTEIYCVHCNVNPSL